MSQKSSYDVVSLAQAIAKHGIASAGVIVDVSGSVPQDEIRMVAKALAALPSSFVPKVALTDMDVLFSGSKDEAVSKMVSGTIRGGGTDFKRVVSKAWAGMGNPPALVLISDGDSDRWPQPFPVPTVLLLIDRTMENTAPTPNFKWPRYMRLNTIPAAGKNNVLAIEKISLPQIQDLRRGLE